jgi:LemA protein
MITLTVIVLLLCVLGFFSAKTYNCLQTLLQQVREMDSNMQIAVRKKVLLINQMIDVVRNYQEGEQFMQLKVSQDSNDASVKSAYQQSGTMLTSMQNIAERFPNLKANEQYNNLSNSITGCENDVQHYSMVYNTAASKYNTYRLQFPTILVAKVMGFVAAAYAQFDVSSITETAILKQFKTNDSDRLEQLLAVSGSQAGDTKSVSGQSQQNRPQITIKLKDANHN